MENTGTDNTNLPKSEILTEEQISAIVNGEQDGVDQQEIQLPSEEGKEPDKAEYKQEPQVPANIVDEFTKRYQEKGGFDEQDYKDLEAQGYSKEFVDTYVEGVQAKEMKALEAELAIFNSTFKDFEQAVEWAAANWDKTQIEKFNEAIVATKDIKVQAFLAGTLVKEMRTAKAVQQPTVPNAPIHTSSAPPVVKNEGYATKSDYIKDASDPRYSKDSAYRAKVEAKLLATDTKQWYVGIPKGE